MKYLVTLNNTNYEVEVEESEVSLVSATPVVAAAPVAAAAPAAAAPAASGVAVSTASGEKITSPMPGTILAVNVSVGSAVKKGDVIMILEAMKMENDIVASCDGTVKEVLAQKGSAVQTGDVLAVI
ncbi:MAG: biotin/lipoyl-binding protein [Clostridia bacterium]|nr:biotin/lipoyl-binding protein [Clostridia bacterium]